MDSIQTLSSEPSFVIKNSAVRNTEQISNYNTPTIRTKKFGERYGDGSSKQSTAANDPNISQPAISNKMGAQLSLRSHNFNRNQERQTIDSPDFTGNISGFTLDGMSRQQLESFRTVNDDVQKTKGKLHVDIPQRESFNMNFKANNLQNILNGNSPSIVYENINEMENTFSGSSQYQPNVFMLRNRTKTVTEHIAKAQRGMRKTRHPKLKWLQPLFSPNASKS